MQARDKLMDNGQIQRLMPQWDHNTLFSARQRVRTYRRWYRNLQWQVYGSWRQYFFARPTRHDSARSWLLRLLEWRLTNFPTYLLTYIAKSNLTIYGHIKPQSNGPLYSSTVMVRWPLMGGLLHLVRVMKGFGGLRLRPIPSSLYKM